LPGSCLLSVYVPISGFFPAILSFKCGNCCALHKSNVWRRSYEYPSCVGWLVFLQTKMQNYLVGGYYGLWNSGNLHC
jgi:hypothetical protein